MAKRSTTARRGSDAASPRLNESNPGQTSQRPEKPPASQRPDPPQTSHVVSATRRIVLSRLQPDPHCGVLHAVVGDLVPVAVDVLCDGDAAVRACILYKADGDHRWRPAPLVSQPGPRRWAGDLKLQHGGRMQMCVEAWVDVFATWEARAPQRRDTGRVAELRLHWLRAGADVLELAMRTATGADLRLLAERAESLREAAADTTTVGAGFADFLQRWRRDRELHKRMLVHGERRHVVRSPVLAIQAQRKRAALGVWCELAADDASSVEELPSRCAELGVDVVHLRQGVGSLSPALSALATSPVPSVEVAWDLALPRALEPSWEHEHTDWFVTEPGNETASLDFWCADRDALWDACLTSVRARVVAGARLLVATHADAVPLPFWDWMLRRLRGDSPDALVVADAVDAAYARGLSRLGFAQVRRHWDGRVAQAADDVRRWCGDGERNGRLQPTLPAAPSAPAAFDATELRTTQLLAATLFPSFALRGVPGDPQARQWIARLTAWRRENRALQGEHGTLLPTTDARLLAVHRFAPRGRNDVILVVNTTPHESVEAELTLPPLSADHAPGSTVALEDLLDGRRYEWTVGRNYVRLAPQQRRAHLLRVLRPTRLPF